jgi:hypothetical protein
MATSPSLSVSFTIVAELGEELNTLFANSVADSSASEIKFGECIDSHPGNLYNQINMLFQGPI